jgi:hypothetical protein
MMIQLPKDRVILSAARVILGGGAPVSNWWDPNGLGLCVWSAYQPKGAASQAASYGDLTGNGNNAGVGVAPTWDAVNGWGFNGTNQYLTTAFVAQNDQSQSALLQFTNAQHNGAREFAFGSAGGGGLQWGFDISVFGTNMRYFNGGFVQIARNLNAGNLGIAGNQGYWNGASDGGAIGAWTGANALASYIGCANRFGAPDFYAELDIQALAIYDCTLTGGQMLDIANAMAAL